MPDFKSHPLFKKLFSLDLPPEDYAVFGSGPMYAHGLRKGIADLNIIARGKAWQKTHEFGGEQTAHSGLGKAVLPAEGIQIYNAWGPGKWTADELIDTSEIIDGIRFVTLDKVADWKELMGRPKDIEDVEAIKTYLENLKSARNSG
ncbi:MAG: hypothetical protein KGJ13_00870 [Patescibacteria group bacterium]|nr:hypothetical protein [Patescibacteria group bacterium]